MILETRYDLGQKVWGIRRDYAVIELPCGFCRGRGRLAVTSPSGESSASVPCPKCDGRGRARLTSVPEWKLGQEMTIGQVRISATSSPGLPEKSRFSNYGPQSGSEETYMCVETGVGSGSVHYAAALFVSQVEAEEECERRNEETLAGHTWKPDHREVEEARGFLEHRDVYEHEDVHVDLARTIIAAYEYEPDAEEATV